MKTPLYAGALRCSVNSSLCGGYKLGRPKFIPVYQICTPLGRSDCGCDAENDSAHEGLLPKITSIVHLKDSANNPTPMKTIPKFLMTILMMKIVSTADET